MGSVERNLKGIATPFLKEMYVCVCVGRGLWLKMP